MDLRGIPAAVLLTVRDSGVGFDVDEAMNSPGQGRIGMRERVNLSNGTISITSKPLAGTEINVRISIATEGSQIAVRGEREGVDQISADLACW